MRQTSEIMNPLAKAVKNVERAAARRAKQRSMFQDDEPDDSVEVKPDPRHIRKF